MRRFGRMRAATLFSSGAVAIAEPHRLITDPRGRFLGIRYADTNMVVRYFEANAVVLRGGSIAVRSCATTAAQSTRLIRSYGADPLDIGS